MYESQFIQQLRSDEITNNDIEYKFGCYIRYFLDRDREFIGNCICQARKLAKDDVLIKISAHYVFLLNEPENDDQASLQEIAKHTARNIIWPLFRMHFAHIDAQASLDMPDLPYDPSVVAEQSRYSAEDD